MSLWPESDVADPPSITPVCTVHRSMTTLTTYTYALTRGTDRAALDRSPGALRVRSAVADSNECGRSSERVLG